MAGEHLIGFDSPFYAVVVLARRLSVAGVEFQVLDPGFDCAIAGVKPGTP